MMLIVGIAEPSVDIYIRLPSLTVARPEMGGSRDHHAVHRSVEHNHTLGTPKFLVQHGGPSLGPPIR